MKVMVLYATCEGQTGKIARAVAEKVRALGHDAVVCNAEDSGEIDLAQMDAAILAAPVHERRHPRRFEALVNARRDELSGLRTLMLSVSLSAAFPEGLEEAGDYLAEMEMRTGFTPNAELLVAGAVRIDEYDFFATQVVRHVVLRGRPYDPRAGSHEFTDWAALEAGVADFLA